MDEPWMDSPPGWTTLDGRFDRPNRERAALEASRTCPLRSHCLAVAPRLTLIEKPPDVEGSSLKWW